MFRRKLTTFLMVAAPVLVMVYGLHLLFTLRLESGDVYPISSSLRADPLGTRIVYESLERLPGLKVTRNYEPLSRVVGAKDTTYLFLGMESRWIPEAFYSEVSRLALEGGRVVLGFAHERDVEPDKEEEAEATNAVSCAADAGADTNACAARSFWLCKNRLWGASLEYRGRELSVTGAVPGEMAAPAPATAGGLDPVPWPSALYFQPLDKSWQTLYVRDGRSVLIERSFGKGTVVLVADGYFLSNEALLKARRIRLIGLVLGSSRTLVFDESHLGIRNGSGVMALVWKYRLYGLVLALLSLGGLFLWSSLATLLPMAPEAADEADAAVTGMNARQGYYNLLKRNIDARDLPALCVAEWEKSAGRAARSKACAARVKERLARAETSVPFDPVQAYRQISQCIKESGKT